MDWVVKNEFINLRKLLENNKIKVSESKICFNSKIYLPDRYSLRRSIYKIMNNEVFFDYFHGDPRISKKFFRDFNYIIGNKSKFDKIRITHNSIKNLFLENNLSEKQLQKIYLPVDIENFYKIDLDKINKFKELKKIPRNAFIVGSFQKDSNGWLNSKEPKFIKGPDILVATLKILNEKISDLFVLLIGPQRGYVKEMLTRYNIKFFHFEAKDKYELNYFFNCLNVYLICSRQEGGPKTFLESLACQVPVVATNVGQIQDLGVNNFNSKICKSFDPNEIFSQVLSIYENINNNTLKINGLETAKKNSYNTQLNNWKRFLNLT